MEESQNGGDSIVQHQAEAFWHCAQAGQAVGRRPQFFVWAQASLQRLLPHQVMLCWSWSPRCRQMQPVLFNSLPLPDPLAQWLQEPATLGALQQVWQQRGGRALSWSLACPPEGLEALSQATDANGASMRSLLQGAGLEALACHGVARPQAPAALETFFVLASRAPLLPARVELVMPLLHAAWRRVEAQEWREDRGACGGRASLVVAGSSGVTAREREVLEGIRQGKSNQEIGLHLGISALTVKNHVQKILRKLAAKNRAQAVAQALGRQWLSEGGGR